MKRIHVGKIKQLTKKMLAVLDKAEVRWLITKGMNLKAKDSYRMSSNESLAWICENTLTFLEVDIDKLVKDLKGLSGFRKNIPVYLKDLQAYLKGEIDTKPILQNEIEETIEMEEETSPEETTEETVQLGGNIELSGFKEVDGGTMIILKKIIGTYARKFSDTLKNFEKLSVTMKTIHETESSKKYEINAKVIDNGTPHNASITDRNLFVAVDSVMKKLQNSFG